MHFVPARANVVRSITQHWLLQYWDRLRKGRPLPPFDDLDGKEIARTAEMLMFCDVVLEAAAPRFCIRFQGKRITEAFGADCSGKFLDQTLPPPVRDAALAVYRQAVEIRQPVYTVADASDRQGRPVCCERLLLPFSTDGTKVDRIVSSLEMVSIAGAFEQAGHDDVAAGKSQLFPVGATISLSGAAQAGA